MTILCVYHDANQIKINNIECKASNSLMHTLVTVSQVIKSLLPRYLVD